MRNDGGSISKVLWLVTGAMVYALAGLASFVLVETWLGGRAALAAAFAVMVGPPLVAAALLSPALRRGDPEARFGTNALGLGGLWAVVVLVAIGFLGRAPIAASLAAAPTRHPGAGATIHRLATAAAELLAPPPPSPAPAAHPATSAQAAASPPSAAPPAPDAAAPAPLGPPDAGSPEQPRAHGERDAAPPPNREPALFAEVDMGDLAFDVQTGDLDGDAIDEILVKTLEQVHVLTLTARGALVELLLFSPTPGPDLRVAAGSPGFGDANHDGRLDVLLCATFQSKGGGTRGGQTWFAPWKADGGFSDLVTIESVPCMAVAMGDVTGDGQAELFIAHTGNPWQKEQPNGEVAWRSRAGRQWTPRGRLPTRIYPDRLSLLEVTGDGILDVVVSHGWDRDDPTVLLVGGKDGLRAAPTGSEPPAEPDKARASARFDDDGIADAVVLSGAKLRLLRTRPHAGELIRRFEAAPHPVPPPPATSRPASPPAP